MVELFVFFGQRLLFRPFPWKNRVWMKTLQTLIARVSSFRDLWMNERTTFFVETKIMYPANTKSHRFDFFKVADDQLSFEGVTLLFA